MQGSLFFIQTFGCQMNAEDSDWLARALGERGFRPGSAETADVYILNTCSVRDKPEQKVYSELGRIACAAREGRRKLPLICVGGCVAQQIGERLIKRFPQVRLLFGPDGVPEVPDAIARLLRHSDQRAVFLQFHDAYQERDPLWHGRSAPLSAFVTIMQGCDNFCTYCIVPFVRGKPKSRCPQAVLDECAVLAAAGAKEIILLGQNVNAYGLDRPQGLSFTALLERISRLPGIERIRFLTSHPKDVDPDLIRLFADNDKLCPRLHLPLQSGSDRILRKMNRGYTRAAYLDLLYALRRARPELLVSTDIIVGFPGETEEDFSQTMLALEAGDFFASFSFVYSDRPGAKAAQFAEKVDRSLALERLSRVQEWQAAQSAKLLAAFPGMRARVLLAKPLIGAESLENAASAWAGGSVLRQRQGGCYWQGTSEHALKVLAHIPEGVVCTGGDLISVRLEAVSRQTLFGHWLER